MEFSQQYIAALVVVIISILDLFNINYDVAALTQIIGAIVILVSGVWIMVRRYKEGDINIAGVKSSS